MWKKVLDILCRMWERAHLNKMRVYHKVSPLQFLGTDYTDYTDFVLKPHAKVQLY